MAKEIVYQLLPSQEEFVYSEAKETLFSGGFGSGKSRALCYALLRHAVIPGNVILLVRKTLVSLKKSTLLTLIGGSEPVLPKGSYQYNKSEGLIKVNGGATIYAAGCDDPVRIRSMNLGAVFMDEVTEFSEDEYTEIGYRLRLKEGTRQMYCCGNPAGTNHFLYKRFFLKDSPKRRVVTASSLENTYLPEDYIEALKEMSGGKYKRYVEGQWCQVEGAIFEAFDRNIHVKPTPKSLACESYLCGIDYGYTHPTGLLVCGIAGDRVYVVREFKRAKCLLRDIMREVRDIRDLYNPVFVYDPSAAGLGGELRNAEINCVKADNDVASGIDRIRNRLHVRNDSPDIIVGDQCVQLIQEMETYSYQPGTESPVKENDDLVDPLRYVMNYIDNDKAEHAFQPFLMAAGEEDDPGDEGWTHL